MDKNNPEKSELGKLVDKGAKATNDFLSDKDNQEKIKKGAKIAGIGILGYIIIVAVIAIISTIIGFVVFFKIFSTASKNIDNANNFINDVSEKVDEAEKQDKEFSDKVSETQKEGEITVFNTRFEHYQGTQNGASIKSMLTFMSSSNRRNRVHKITVTYGETSTLEPEEIISLRDSFNDGSNYEVALNYDENGYINSATIK